MKIISGYKIKSNFDWPLLVAVLLIAILGVINLYSATSIVNKDLYITQIYWIFFGAAAGGVLASIDYHYLEKYAYYFYIIGVILLIAVLIPEIGKNVNGSQRWIGIREYVLQPSEPMKIFFILALSKYLCSESKSSSDSNIIRDLIVPAIMLIIPVVLILKEPDLGTALIYILLFFTIMLMTKLKIKTLLILLLIGILTIPISWAYLLKPYQKQRITSFINPDDDPLGASWHSRQSTIAIGSGRLVGKGFMRGTQNQFRFMPAQRTDFPFSLLSEEFGFIGSSVAILLYLFTIIWTIRVAKMSKDKFSILISIGVGTMLFWHVIINIGMTCGLLPVVGVTLPLISSGGSSVLTVMMGIGIVLNISMKRAY